MCLHVCICTYISMSVNVHLQALVPKIVYVLVGSLKHVYFYGSCVTFYNSFLIEGLPRLG
jgi:hypothetical protein